MKMYLDRLLTRHRVPSHSNGFFPWATSHAPKPTLKPAAPKPTEAAHPTRRRRKAAKH